MNLHYKGQKDQSVNVALGNSGTHKCVMREQGMLQVLTLTVHIVGTQLSTNQSQFHK